MFDAAILGGWGSFLLGAAAILTLAGGFQGIKFILRIIRPRHLLERDRQDAIRQLGLATSETASARAEAEAARHEAGSWRSAYDELSSRVMDIEKRVVPKLNAALSFIRSLVLYIEQLEQAMDQAQVKFNMNARMPAVPKELSDDLSGL